MSQLTKEQIKVWREKLHELGFNTTEASAAISEVQQELAPLPSYGEISFRAYNACFPLNESLSWVGISERARNAEEAGAQAVIEEAKKRGEFKQAEDKAEG